MSCNPPWEKASPNFVTPPGLHLGVGHCRYTHGHTRSDVCYNTPHFFLQRAQPQPRSLLSPRPNFVTTVAREPPLATTSPRERSSSASLQWPRSHTRTTHQQLHHHHGNFSSSATSFGSRTLSSQRPSCRAGPFMNNTCPHGSVQVFIPARARPTFGHVCYFTLLLAAQPQPRSLSSPRYNFVTTAVAREPPHSISPHEGLSSASLQWPRSHACTTHQQLCLHHGNFSSLANSYGSRTLSAQRPSAHGTLHQQHLPNRQSCPSSMPATVISDALTQQTIASNHTPATTPPCGKASHQPLAWIPCTQQMAMDTCNNKIVPTPISRELDPTMTVLDGLISQA